MHVHELKKPVTTKRASEGDHGLAVAGSKIAIARLHGGKIGGLETVNASDRASGRFEAKTTART